MQTLYPTGLYRIKADAEVSERTGEGPGDLLPFPFPKGGFLTLLPCVGKRLQLQPRQLWTFQGFQQRKMA